MTHTGLLFSGQGAQTIGMGASLYQKYPEAKKLFDQANTILGFDLKKICFEGPDALLTQTTYCQPALYLHGYCAYMLLKKSPIFSSVKAVLGLSLGELTALAVAGVYDFETGLKLVAKRGRLMQEACLQTQGAMASLLGGTLDMAKILCKECDVDLANLNCPGQIVISGQKEKIEHAVHKAKEMSFKRVIPLNVAGAYHSRLMRSAAEGFSQFLNNIPFQKPSIAVFTNTTGKLIEDPQAIKEALVHQIVAPVLFEDCLRNAAMLGIKQFFECGPGGVLSGLAKRTLDGTKVLPINQAEDLESVLGATICE